MYVLATETVVICRIVRQFFLN